MKTLLLITCTATILITSTAWASGYPCGYNPSTNVHFNSGEIDCENLVVATAKTVGELQSYQAKPQYIDENNQEVDGVPPFLIKYKKKIDDGDWSDEIEKSLDEDVDNIQIYDIEWKNPSNLTFDDTDQTLRNQTVIFAEISGGSVTPPQTAAVRYELTAKTDNWNTDWQRDNDDLSCGKNALYFTYYVWNRRDKDKVSAADYDVGEHLNHSPQGESEQQLYVCKENSGTKYWDVDSTLEDNGVLPLSNTPVNDDDGD